MNRKFYWHDWLLLLLYFINVVGSIFSESRYLYFINICGWVSAFFCMLRLYSWSDKDLGEMNLTLGYVNKDELDKHYSHRLEIARYGYDGNIDSVTIECIDCNCVLIDSEEEDV